MRTSLGLLVLLAGLGVAYQFSSLPARSPPAPLLPGGLSQRFDATPVAAALISPVAVSSATPRANGLSKCEQLWEPATHMDLEEWAQACRRVGVD